MDNSNYPRNRHSDHLGVNKIGKNIRKTPLPQPNYANPDVNPDVNPSRPVSQPQVYNINKNDFRNIVQQLTGSPSHHSHEPLPIPIPVPRPPHISPSLRLQRIRPPPLSPISVNRPRLPVHIPPARPSHDPLAPGQLPQRTALQPPLAGWANTAESPVSAYVRYLQRSINDPGDAQAQSAGLLPNPRVPPPVPSPGLQPLLPSPSSQFLLQSPSGYLNLSSPRSPYLLLPPGYQHPPPLTPNFPFSPMGRVGILGPGPQGPPSPGISFPLSPGFFPLSSPKWRD